MADEMTNEELTTLMRSLQREVEDLRRWKTFHEGASVGAASSLFPHANTDVVANSIQAGTISGSEIYLNDGGFIEDSEGSRWDEDGITLISSAIAQDFIKILSTEEEHTINVQGFMQPDNVNLQLLVQRVVSGIIQYWSALVMVAEDDNASATLQAAFGGLSLTALTLYDDKRAEISSNGLGQLRLALGGTRSAASYGNGLGVIFIHDSAQPPTTVNPSLGGFLYSDGGALKWRGSSGTVTTVAPA